MAGTKHTAGPWEVLDIGEVVSGDDFDVVIATIDFATEFGEANANLIAAAPDLLAALKRLLDHHADYINDLPGPFGVGDLETARKAINRVEGSSHG